MKSKLASRLDYLRFINGDMTKQELAERIGVSRQTITNIESGGNANIDTLQLLADEFHVSLDYLMGNSDNINPNIGISTLELSDAAIYLLRQNKTLGKVISLLIEDESFRKVVADIDRDFSSTEDLGHDINTSMYDKVFGKIKEIKPGVNEENDETLAFLKHRADSSKVDEIKGYIPQLEQTLVSIRNLYHTDSAQREKLIRIKGAVSDMTNKAAEKVKAGEPIDKMEMMKEYLSILGDIGAVPNDNESQSALAKIIRKMTGE